jgi:hypothetical protein
VLLLLQHRSVVGGAPGGRRRHAVEAHLPQVESLDTDLNHAHRIVVAHIVVDDVLPEFRNGSKLE